MCSSPLTYLLTLGLALFLSQGSCLDFNFSSFQREDGNNLILSQNSYIAVGAIQVTPDINGDSMANRAGRALYNKRFRLWEGSKGNGTVASFNTTFVLNIQNQTSPGGEGLAFIITGNSSVPDDSHGRWLGIVNSDSNGTSDSGSGIVAVEFDTRKSDDEDLDGNHIGLNINSINSVAQVSLSDFGFNISRGLDLRVHLQYDDESLTVRVNDTLVLSEHVDLSLYLPEEVFIGFSASTSDEIQLNCVKSWWFSGTDIGGDGSLWWVWIVIPAAVLMVLTVVLVFYLYRRRGTIDNDMEGGRRDIEDEIKRSGFGPKKFRFEELKQATANFSRKNKLGKGGFGTVYKGSWKNQDVAIKRVSKKSNQGKQEFLAEVTTIGNLNHKNLVKLIGWCYERRELLLVYEYMPNGSLDKFIFCYDKASTEECSTTLNWEQRLTIIQGVAQALEYLHNGCQQRVLHRDIKASNIMLDSEYIAKLGDFGLARTIREKEKTHHSTVEIAGTPGYMAPETFLISRATIETDVYSFGVLVLEVVCGRKPGNQSEQKNYNNSIVYWLWELYKNGRITAGVDSRMETVDKEAERVLVLGLSCCHPNPHYRPCMRIVLQVLSGEADPPEVPKERPSFVWPDMPPSFSHMDYSLRGSQLTPFTDLTGR